MEEQEGNRMILDLKESQELFDWLLQRGLNLGEAAYVLCDIISGHSLGVALVKVWEYRNLLKEGKDESSVFDWGNPITP